VGISLQRNLVASPPKQTSPPPPKKREQFNLRFHAQEQHIAAWVAVCRFLPCAGKAVGGCWLFCLQNLRTRKVKTNWGGFREEQSNDSGAGGINSWREIKRCISK